MCQFILTILIRFLLPESLSREARSHLRKRANASHKASAEREAAERAWEDADDLDSSDDGSAWSRVSSVRGRTKRRLQGNLRRFARKLFAPLASLGVFLPLRVDGKVAHSRQAWSMTWIGVLIFLNSITMGVVPFKLQYALFAFQWGPSIVGPYLSFISLCRVITLVVLLPSKCHMRPVTDTQSRAPLREMAHCRARAPARRRHYPDSADGAHPAARQHDPRHRGVRRRDRHRRGNIRDVHPPTGPQPPSPSSTTAGTT